MQIVANINPNDRSTSSAREACRGGLLGKIQPNRFFIRLRQRVEISPPQKGKKHKRGDRTARRLSPTRVRVTSSEKNHHLEISPNPIRKNEE